MVKISRGSEWRIWDLHVHSPATYRGTYEEFISNASISNASVIGINDYCTIEGYKAVHKLGGIPGKVIFPVVELRMNNIIESRRKPNGVKINFHIIFDNNPQLLPTIDTWLGSLKCYDENGDNVQLGAVTDRMKVTFNYDEVVEKLKEFKLYGKHAFVWLPYDEYGGIDEISPTDGNLKIALINKAHFIGTSTQKQIAFFRWEDEKYTQEQYQEMLSTPKPCIKGSDAHKINYPFGHLQDENSEPTDKYCWINADTTFNGLKQAIVEPHRIHIGKEPHLLQRVRTNKTKFINSIKISKNDGVSLDDVWFDNTEIPINSGLVAIIGKKGSGKSAITDIASLCGNTHQDPSNFSFLTPLKFRKIKPLNLSDRFNASLIWEDGSVNSKKLNEDPDRSLAERIKYIPQNFLEKLCNNLDSDDFENELKQIIFSHTPVEDRLGKNSLDQLIDYKSEILKEEAREIKNDISTINNKIIQLESISTMDYKRYVEDKLNIKKAELAAHQTILPQKPDTVPGEKPVSEASDNELEIKRNAISKLELEIGQLKEKRNELTINIERLKRTYDHYINISNQYQNIVSPTNEHNIVLAENGININDIIEVKVNTALIKSKIDAYDSERIKIAEDLLSDNPKSKVYLLSFLTAELQKLQDELDKPGREYQKYLNELKEWEIKKRHIVGEVKTEDSLSFLEAQLNYLNTKLATDLEKLYLNRKTLIVKIFDFKNRLTKIRKDLFEPVTKFIAEFKELQKRYDVKLDVSLELKTFPDTFFSYVNQQKKGTFTGKEDGYKNLTSLLDQETFQTSESFVSFTENLLNALKFDTRFNPQQTNSISSQLRKGAEVQELYDYIFQFDYIQPVYNLKLGTKSLLELSPGERGALLLIFYLILDKDDIPLIIDQPEENLDNESVYHILVHFIKKTKERRQIILVTHNPNLAIVCDADQIIHMNIEKDNKNTVRFYSGAIEEDIINKTVVDILEGTLPAFNNRDMKYIKLN